MTVKLVLLKSGEDIIADVTEMRVGEDKDAKIIGYFFDKACIVKLKEGQDSTEKKSAFKISMFPWMPLSKDQKIPVTADWVITIVEPVTKLTEMYVEDIINYKKDKPEEGRLVGHGK